MSELSDKIEPGTPEKPASQKKENRARERELKISKWKIPIGDLEIALLVLFAGACGGLIAFGMDWKVMPIWADGEAKALAKPISKLWLLPIGASAAGITVFYIAKSDTRNILHTFFFALLCGTCGPGVLLQAMSKMVDMKQSTLISLGEVKKDAAQGNEEKAALGGLTVRDTANRGGYSLIANEAQQTVVQSVESVAKIAETGQGEVIEKAVASLGVIRAEAVARNNPQVVLKIDEEAARLPTSLKMEVGGEATNDFKEKIKKIASEQNIRIISYRTKPEIMPSEVRLLYYKQQDESLARAVLKEISNAIDSSLEVFESDGSKAGISGNLKQLNENAFVHYIIAGEARQDILPRQFELRLGKDRIDALASKPSPTPEPTQKPTQKSN